MEDGVQGQPLVFQLFISYIKNCLPLGAKGPGSP